MYLYRPDGAIDAGRWAVGAGRVPLILAVIGHNEGAADLGTSASYERLSDRLVRWNETRIHATRWGALARCRSSMIPRSRLLRALRIILPSSTRRPNAFC